MRCIFVLAVLFAPLFLSAQVVNTEKLRTNSQERPWWGEADASYQLTRNKIGQTLGLSARLRLEYQKASQRILLFGGYGLIQFLDVNDPAATPINFANSGFAHLRHNYHLGRRLTWETFTQTQFDQIQEIRVRWLNGTGPRFELIANDTAHLYVGLLYMFEYEETTDTDPFTLNRDHRLSSYVSAGFRLNPYLVLNHVSYFQPNLRRFQDFRVNSETTLDIKIKGNLTLRNYFLLVYDAQPPLTVPRVMYSVTTGLGLSF